MQVKHPTQTELTHIDVAVRGSHPLDGGTECSRGQGSRGSLATWTQWPHGATHGRPMLLSLLLLLHDHVHLLLVTMLSIESIGWGQQSRSSRFVDDEFKKQLLHGNPKPGFSASK